MANKLLHTLQEEVRNTSPSPGWRSMESDSFVLLPDQMYGAAVEDTDGGGCSDNGGAPPF